MDKLFVEWSDEELRVTFDLFDTNKDGKISKDELSQVLQNLGSQANEEELESKKIIYALLNRLSEIANSELKGDHFCPNKPMLLVFKNN